MSPELLLSGKPPSNAAFPPTQWSLVLHARGGGADTQARAALESLCRQYWYPLYAFIRRQGRAHHEAEDCIQEFFARLLSSQGISHARPEGGRFRSFLLVALRNFLCNEWHRTQAAKRGGGQAPLPFEFETAEQRYSREPADLGRNPEQMYDRNWAQSMIDQAVSELRDEYEQSGRGDLFATLEPLLWHDAHSESHVELGHRHGLKPHAFTVALQRLRRRLGERLRLNVAQTVAKESDVDAELHHLIAAVSHP